MSRSWQRQERIVAKWLGTRRNPLSGSNNYGDRGQKRFGDIIIDGIVVEVKRHKAISMRKAIETRDQARKAGLKWAHFEFKTGQADMVAITVDHAHAEIICRALLEFWRAPS